MRRVACTCRNGKLMRPSYASRRGKIDRRPRGRSMPPFNSCETHKRNRFFESFFATASNTWLLFYVTIQIDSRTKRERSSISSSIEKLVGSGERYRSVANQVSFRFLLSVPIFRRVLSPRSLERVTRAPIAGRKVFQLGEKNLDKDCLQKRQSSGSYRASTCC